jgi:hypothetical protein
MRQIWSTAIVSVAISVAAAAQSGKEMDKPMMGDRTNMTYTGCIESVNHGARFLLTNVAHEMTMGHDDMKHDEMMKNEDHMMPGSLNLTGSSDLKNHVGQKVAVTGSVSKGSMSASNNDLDTLTIGSLKVVAKRCS